jgi:hypothetical protein
VTESWGLLIVGSALLLMSAIPANGVVAEFLRVPWQESPLGRVLFAKALSLALVLDLSLIGSVLLIFDFGRPVWFEILRLIVFTGVSISLWFQWRTYHTILEAHTRAARHVQIAEDDAREAAAADE